MVDVTVIAMVLIIIITALIILANGIRIIHPYEQAIYMKLGRFVRLLDQGFNFIVPLISQTVTLDLRTQVLDVPRQEVITRDNSPVYVDAIIYIKVVDTKKAYFEVTDYRTATIYLAQTTLRSIIGEMELDEILYSREKINVQLRDILDESTDKWGVKVEAVEIREVDPAPKVKQSMEEQTSAERLRRAAILSADGSKRAAILNAEGEKQSRILEAEGVRQAKVLEAEGERLSIILQSQGEAQKLRILSVGSSALDSKALTVLSLDTLNKLGEGASTKFVLPFELTHLIEGVSEYVGSGRKVPEREISDVTTIEEHVGKVEDILGPIPKYQELRDELDSLSKMLDKEKAEAERIASIASRADLNI